MHLPRTVVSTAKRAALIPAGFRGAVARVREALSPGDVDAYLVISSASRDEEFHGAEVADQLPDGAPDEGVDVW